MLVILRTDCTVEECSQIEEAIERLGYKPLPVPGAGHAPEPGFREPWAPLRPRSRLPVRLPLARTPSTVCWFGRSAWTRRRVSASASRMTRWRSRRCRCCSRRSRRSSRRPREFMSDPGCPPGTPRIDRSAGPTGAAMSPFPGRNLPSRSRGTARDRGVAGTGGTVRRSSPHTPPGHSRRRRKSGKLAAS